MIKYLGSKRRLVPVLGELYSAATGDRPGTALDLFTGTTRVAQELKHRGAHVTAVDTARYSEVFARCYIELDATTVDERALDAALAHLAGLPGTPGYFTETFCVASRFFQPFLCHHKFPDFQPQAFLQGLFQPGKGGCLALPCAEISHSKAHC